MRKARVFISCGQRGEREKNIGLEVEKFFREKGFITYFAERVHSPEALTENIFSHLKKSEYFVFIDFKRDKIGEDIYRGSLFVNQELGISTFLKIPNLGFYEKGVIREGIANFQIYNAFPFENGTEIINNLRAETHDWDPYSVNELIINYNPDTVQKNIILNTHPSKPLTDWWYLEVKNRHNTIHAYNCCAYLSRITDLNSNKEMEIPTLELIWSGLGDHTVNIMAKGRRAFDAFYVIHDDNKIHFHSRQVTTSISNFRLPELSRGSYLLEYTIISSNFDEVKREINLIHENSSDEIKVIQIE